MPTIVRESGCQVMIYPHDHPPPHVHVKVGGGVVIINLIDDATVRKAVRVSDNDIRKARGVVTKHLVRLLAAWNEIHA